MKSSMRNELIRITDTGPVEVADFIFATITRLEECGRDWSDDLVFDLVKDYAAVAEFVDLGEFLERSVKPAGDAPQARTEVSTVAEDSQSG
jgi:hypothetical protein